MINLNSEQTYALNKMLSGKNLFITAPAGAGKSTIVEEFKNKCKKRLLITSTTGISAYLISGNTLHSALKIGLGNESVAYYINLFEKKSPLLGDVWRKIDVLIIDEVSMLDPALFDKLNTIAKIIRKDSSPFGGIQLILFGDLLQLPVVKSTQLIIEAKSWKSCIEEVIFLKTIHRQKDEDFKRILLKIRIANIDNDVIEILNKCTLNKIKKDALLEPTKLFCLRKTTDEYNFKKMKEFEQNNETMYAFNAKIVKISNNCDYFIDRFIKNSNTQERIILCKGAQVVHTINSPILGLVNGSRGVVVSIEKGKILVKFTDGKTVNILPHVWEILGNDLKKAATFKQLPLKIAFALTVHSCQGSTLDLAEVDLQGAFEYGQIYTALSRVKDCESLFIKNLDLKSIKAHPTALEFYDIEECIIDLKSLDVYGGEEENDDDLCEDEEWDED